MVAFSEQIVAIVGCLQHNETKRIIDIDRPVTATRQQCSSPSRSSSKLREHPLAWSTVGLYLTARYWSTIYDSGTRPKHVRQLWSWSDEATAIDLDKGSSRVPGPHARDASTSTAPTSSRSVLKLGHSQYRVLLNAYTQKLQFLRHSLNYNIFNDYSQMC